MDVVKLIAIIAVSYLAVSFVATVSSYFIVNREEPIFPFKPFTCYPCMTFWANFAYNSFLSVFWYQRLAVPREGLYALLAFSLALSLALFFHVKSKYKITK